MNLLNKINNHTDFLRVPEDRLPELCRELREFMLDHIAHTGGHLASNLGTVELTVALHRVYDPEKDRILFDVGHQSYTHKILTGRRDAFESLRQLDGISGFPKPCESVCDPFVAGHASDSVSVGLGMARARTLLGETYDVVSVIGDGALTGGLSFEALCDAAQSGEPFVIVLNDNGMSINANVGGMARFLSQARLRPSYISFKRRVRNRLMQRPFLYRAVHKLKEALKDRLLPSNIFNDLGLYYIGPADGHNVRELETQLRWARELHKPVLFHVVTVKGRGVDYAEENPRRYHGVAPFDSHTGEVSGGAYSFSECFGETLCHLAENDRRVCGVTAAMADGTGLSAFAAEYPKRFFDVGIAEEHATALCGGLARQGMIPVFAVYASFLQRAYDELIEDWSLMGLHAVLGVDRWGLVGADGETHQGTFGAAFLSSVPGMHIYAPASYAELRDMLVEAVEREEGPTAVCYPRGGEGGLYTGSHPGERSTILREGTQLTIVSHGVLINEAIEAADRLAAEGISAELIKLNSLRPLDTLTVNTSVRKTGRLIVAEELCRAGSPGTNLLSAITAAQIPCVCRLLDTGSGIVTHGDIPSLRRRLGLDAAGIYRTAMGLLNEKNQT